MILYKNIVYTIPFLERTTCHTFKELSNPHETIFVPRDDKRIPVTDDLFVGRL